MRILGTLLLLSGCAAPVPASAPPVQVFLLAGQSNMEGKGAVNTLAHLGDDPEHGHLLATARGPDGDWIVRDDVHVWFLDREGPLTVGFGSAGSSHGPLIGPELGFGIVVGARLEAPVLLVKTAWGGKDVANDFRPPGTGGPGPYYAEMLEHLRAVLADLGAHVPGYAGEGYELAGCVWFQGWNDMVDEAKTAAYTENLAQLVHDLRADVGVSDLPVVIGELGANGPEAGAKIAAFREAQAAVPAQPGLEHGVRFVRTAPYYDLAAHALYEEDVWKGPDKQRFYAIASDRPYHYLGSGKTYFLMGHAFGEAMLELMAERASD